MSGIKTITAPDGSIILDTRNGGKIVEVWFARGLRTALENSFTIIGDDKGEQSWAEIVEAHTGVYEEDHENPQWEINRLPMDLAARYVDMADAPPSPPPTPCVACGGWKELQPSCPACKGAGVLADFSGLTRDAQIALADAVAERFAHFQRIQKDPITAALNAGSDPSRGFEIAGAAHSRAAACFDWLLQNPIE